MKELEGKMALPVLLRDFVWGHRRLEERADVSLTVESSGRVDDLDIVRLAPDDVYAQRGIRISHVGGSFLEICADRSLRPDELGDLNDLIALAIYFASVNRLPFARKLGRRFKILRESFGLAQTEVAEQAKVTGVEVSEWESGTQAPDAASMYRWCQALGLVCPLRANIGETLLNH